MLYSNYEGVLMRLLARYSLLSTFMKPAAIFALLNTLFATSSLAAPAPGCSGYNAVPPDTDAGFIERTLLAHPVVSPSLPSLVAV